MKKNPKSNWSLLAFFKYALTLCFFATLSFTLFAAPTPKDGLETTIRQEDGTEIPVRAFGDEFYLRAETMDGYSIVRNGKNWDYATLDANGAFVSTGKRVGRDQFFGKQKSLKEKPEVVKAKADAVYNELRVKSGEEQKMELLKIQRMANSGFKTETVEAAVKNYNVKYQKTPIQFNSATKSFKTLSMSPDGKTAMAQEVELPLLGGDHNSALPAQVKGILLLVDFSDAVGTFTAAEIEAMANQLNYTGHDNKGSVRDYYLKQSNGKLDLTWKVPTQYLRMPYTKAYYEGLATGPGDQSWELVRDAVTAYNAAYPNENMDDITLDKYGDILAFSIFYAGASRYGTALWPHKYGVYADTIPTFSSGKTVCIYQMTNIGSALSIGTFCHESGHSVCGFNDFYDYGSRADNGGQFKSAGIGDHCLMSAGNYNGNGKAPASLSCYLRTLMGWMDCTDITGTTTQLNLNANNNMCYRYYKPGSSTEFFMIENRYGGTTSNITDHYQYNLPDQGVAIWHVDVAMRNNDMEDMTATEHYELSLEQADGKLDLEHDSNYGDTSDYYDGASGRTEFSGGTTPNSSWWDGTISKLKISNIPAPAATVTVDVSFGDFIFPPVITPGTQSFESNFVATITCSTEGAVIRYTLDGTDPTGTSTLYPAAGIQISTGNDVVLKARAFKDGLDPSAVTTARYYHGIPIRITNVQKKYGFDDEIVIEFMTQSNMDVTLEYLSNGTSNGINSKSCVANTLYTVNLGTNSMYNYVIWPNESFVISQADNPEISASCVWQVGNLQEITLNSSADVALSVNATSQINVAAAPENASTTTYVSQDPNIVSVSSDGLIRGLAQGQTQIKINRAQNNNTLFLAADEVIVNVTVNPSGPIDQTVTIEGPATMGLGTPDQFSATTTSGNNATWTITSGAAKATIDAETGVLTPKAAGTVTLTASVAASTGYNAASATKQVTIVNDFPTTTNDDNKITAVADKNGVTIAIPEKGRTYTILRSETQNGTYAPVKEDFPGGSYNDNTAVPGKTYFYKLRAQ